MYVLTNANSSDVALFFFVMSNKSYDIQAFDQHLNMVLGNVEETVTTVEVDEETLEEIVRVRLFRPRL